MIDHASKHLDPALTPQILLKSANLIKEIVWVGKKKYQKLISLCVTKWEMKVPTYLILQTPSWASFF